MGIELVAPEAENSRVDGTCKIGIQPHAAMAMLVLDTVLNVILTSIFVWQLRPAVTSLPHHRLSSRAPRSLGNSKLLSITRILKWKNSLYGGAGRSTSENNVRLMLIRNIVGSILLLMNTVANNAIFLSWPYARLSHACLLMCLTDSKCMPDDILGFILTWSKLFLVCSSRIGFRCDPLGAQARLTLAVVLLHDLSQASVAQQS